MSNHEYTLSADGEGYVHNDDCRACADEAERADQARLRDLENACGVNDEEASDEQS